MFGTSLPATRAAWTTHGASETGDFAQRMRPAHERHDRRRVGTHWLPADIGAGDPEAAAGAIPNLIAGLVETETWRNAATVLLGLLLIGLGLLDLHRRAHCPG